MAVFENFKSLKNDMVSKGWVIDAFPFNYNGRNYIVLAKLYQDGDSKPKYALMKMEIMESIDVDRRLITFVNSSGFDIGAKDLREFFHIEYGENIGDILNQFCEYFSQFIPTQVNENKPQQLIDLMQRSLSKSDSQDPNKLYCYDVKRNPEGFQRTPFNDNKTRLLRPSLYSTFENELSISFCYSATENDEETDAEIITKFANRQAN